MGEGASCGVPLPRSYGRFALRKCMSDDKYIRALKRELVGVHAKKPGVRDQILAELERVGAGDVVRTATTDAPVKRKPGRPKKQAE